MNKLKLFTIVAIMLLATSCTESNKTEADKKLGKVEVEIPNELKNKPKVCQYIRDMNKVVDDYAMVFDKIIKEVGKYKGMKEEDLTTSDKIKLSKASAKFGIESLKALSKWGECKQKLDGFEKDLNPDEIAALNVVYQRFEKRMEQIETQNKDFFGETETADNKSSNTSGSPGDLSDALSLLNDLAGGNTSEGKTQIDGDIEELSNQLFENLVDLGKKSADTTTQDPNDVNPLKGIAKMGDLLQDTTSLKEDIANTKDAPKLEDYDFDKLEPSDYQLSKFISEIEAISEIEKTYTTEKRHLILMPFMTREERNVKIDWASNITKEGDEYKQIFTKFDVKKGKNVRDKGDKVELGKIYPYQTAKDLLLIKLSKIDKKAIFKKKDDFIMDEKSYTAYIAQTEIAGSMNDFCVIYSGDNLVGLYYFPHEITHEKNMRKDASVYRFAGSDNDLRIKSLFISTAQKSNGVPSISSTLMEYKY